MVEHDVVDAGLVIAPRVVTSELAADTGEARAYYVTTRVCRAPFGQGLSMQSSRGATDTSPDFSWSTPANRSGAQIELRAGGTSGPTTFRVWPDGTVEGGRQGGAAAFQNMSGESGHATLACSPGLYTVITGRLPAGGYDGKHGAVTLQNDKGMDAGWVVQWRNPVTGTTLDTLGFIDYRGGIGASEHAGTIGPGPRQFHTCPSVDSTPHGYGSGAAPSTLMWATDDLHWFACLPSGWARLVLQPSVDQLAARVSALEARCP